MDAWRGVRRFGGWMACAVLASCGGGGGAGGGGNGGPAPMYAVGGTVSGLQGSVVLQNNGGDDLTVSANGAFTFPTSLADGSTYAVSVRTQPGAPAQTCTVANGIGNVAGADTHAAAVTCTTNTYHVSGSINNLTSAGLVLQLNGGDDLALPAGATQFSFDTPVASGSNYLVSVRGQPTNPTQRCDARFPGAGGTVGSTDVNLTFDCTTVARATCIQGHPEYQSFGYVLRQDGPTVVHSSNVTADETWVGDGAVHVIPNSIAILAPATVTIQSCATVKLASGASIDVQGNLATGAAAKLVAAGAFVTFPDGSGERQPVVFQSMQGTLATSWGRLRAVNKNSFIELHSTSLYGGGNVGGQQLNATLVANGSSNLPDPTLTIDGVSIDARAGTGVYLSNAAFTAGSDGLFIQYASDSLMAMPAMALGSVPTRVFLGTDAFPPPPAGFPPDGDPTVLHTEIKVVENANIFDNLTITTPVPIHFKTAGVHVGGLAPTFIPNVTLTISPTPFYPGVTLRFEGTGGIPPLMTFGDGGQAQDKNAALVVQGTAQQPVVFTSAKPNPAPGDWAGLWLRTSNGSQIDHAIIEYAGGNAAIGPQSCGPIDASTHQRASNTAALIVGDETDRQYVPPAGMVTNTTFRNNMGSYAIDAVWQSTVFGPSLADATNVFGAGPTFCTQNKNLLVGGCVVGGVDQSGCLVP